MNFHVFFDKNTTGNREFEDNSLIQVVPFDKYEIEVRVTPDGRFLGIEGVKVNRDFLSIEQRVKASRVLNTEKYFPEEDE